MQLKFTLPKLQLRDPIIRNKIDHAQNFLDRISNSVPIREINVSLRYQENQNLSIWQRKVKRTNEYKKVKDFRSQLKILMQSCDSTTQDTSMATIDPGLCISLEEQFVRNSISLVPPSPHQTLPYQMIDFKLDVNDKQVTSGRNDTTTLSRSTEIDFKRFALLIQPTTKFQYPKEMNNCNDNSLCTIEQPTDGPSTQMKIDLEQSMMNSTQPIISPKRTIDQKKFSLTQTLHDKFIKHVSRSLDLNRGLLISQLMSKDQSSMTLEQQQVINPIIDQSKSVDKGKQQMFFVQNNTAQLNQRRAAHFDKKFHSKISQLILNTSDPVKRVRNQKLIHFLTQNCSHLLKCLNENEQVKFIDIYSKAMGLCQEVENSRAFLQLSIMMGQHYYDFLDYDKSSFFLGQSLIIGNLQQNFSLNIQTLILFSKLCTRLKHYELSIELLKRALEYSWYVDDFNHELQIYDMLGISFFYSGLIQQAYYFHDKYMTGTVEGKQNRIRINSINRLEHQSRIELDKCTTLDKILLSRLSLPIINIREVMFHKGDCIPIHPSCDQFRETTYLNSSTKSVLRRVMSEPQNKSHIELTNLCKSFDLNEFEGITQNQSTEWRVLKSLPQMGKMQRGPNHFGYVGALHIAIPQSIVEIRQRQQKKEQKNKKINYFDGLHKLEIDQIMEHRGQNLPDLEKLKSKIHQQITQDIIFNKQLKEQWEPVMIKHVNNPKNFTTQGSQYLRKFRCIIESIILDLY